MSLWLVTNNIAKTVNPADLMMDSYVMFFLMTVALFTLSDTASGKPTYKTIG